MRLSPSEGARRLTPRTHLAFLEEGEGGAILTHVAIPTLSAPRNTP